jgi:AbrB family looped-hinge helix DNA binding protein
MAVGLSPKDQHVVQLGARGRLVLPSPLRKKLALEEGDRVVLTVEEDGSVRLASLKQKIRRFKGMFKHLKPGAKWSEELIRQRRDEARREEG